MEKRTENQAKEIKLITASYTGEYEILTVVPKLGAQKVYDPNDYPELEPIMDEFGSMVDSIWVGTTTTDDVKVQVDYMGYWVAERIENASGDDEVMGYIPDLVSQYFQVLTRYPPRLRYIPTWIGLRRLSRIWARKSTAIMRTLTITRGIPSRPGSDIR